MECGPEDVCWLTQCFQNQTSFLTKTMGLGCALLSRSALPSTQTQEDHTSAWPWDIRAPQNLSISQLEGAYQVNLPKILTSQMKKLRPRKEMNFSGVTQLFNGIPECLNPKPVDFPLYCAVFQDKVSGGCSINMDLITSGFGNLFCG